MKKQGMKQCTFQDCDQIIFAPSGIRPAKVAINKISKSRELIQSLIDGINLENYSKAIYNI